MCCHPPGTCRDDVASSQPGSGSAAVLGQSGLDAVKAIEDRTFRKLIVAGFGEENVAAPGRQWRPASPMLRLASVSFGQCRPSCSRASSPTGCVPRPSWRARPVAPLHQEPDMVSKRYPQAVQGEECEPFAIGIYELEWLSARQCFAACSAPLLQFS